MEISREDNDAFQAAKRKLFKTKQQVIAGHKSTCDLKAAYAVVEKVAKKCNIHLPGMAVLLEGLTQQYYEAYLSHGK